MSSKEFISCVMLMPYFGKWPDYIWLFLEGCRRNPSFSFLFLTDCPPVDAPPNVRFVATTIAAVRQRAEAALGTNVALERPYKLCELKPAYGLIFAEHTAGYDFWGFGDIDCVYGNLGRYASQEVLSRVDIFCCRKEYVSGVFTLVRNNELMNRLFMRSLDWRRAFGSSKYVGFDECSGVISALIAGEDIKNCRTEMETMTHVVFDAIASGEVRGYFETVAVEDIHAKTYLAPTGVVQNYTSWMLVHFVIAKRRWYFSFPKWDGIPERYTITRHGFWREDERTVFAKIAAWPWRKAMNSLFGKVSNRAKRKFVQSE